MPLTSLSLGCRQDDGGGGGGGVVSEQIAAARALHKTAEQPQEIILHGQSLAQAD